MRELENAVERAVVLARGGVIRPEDLLLDPAASPPGGGSGKLQEALDEAAVAAIRGALASTGGRRAEAALILGVDRTTLYRLMKRHDLS